MWIEHGDQLVNLNRVESIYINASTSRGIPVWGVILRGYEDTYDCEFDSEGNAKIYFEKIKLLLESQDIWVEAFLEL